MVNPVDLVGEVTSPSGGRPTLWSAGYSRLAKMNIDDMVSRVADRLDGAYFRKP